MKTAVIAGTPIDTRMGVDFLRSRDPEIETVFLPFASTPRECHLFQLGEYAQKQTQMRAHLEKASSAGVRDFFIYCNSLSSSVDFHALAAETGCRIITPGTAYTQLASRFNTIAVLAANCQTPRWAEDVFNAVNPAGYVYGTGCLRLVEAVERGDAPADIVKVFRLDSLCAWYAAAGAEALVLGCTHFPYFADALREVCPLPVIDPAEVMYAELMAK